MKPLSEGAFIGPATISYAVAAPSLRPRYQRPSRGERAYLRRVIARTVEPVVIRAKVAESPVSSTVASGRGLEVELSPQKQTGVPPPDGAASQELDPPQEAVIGCTPPVVARWTERQEAVTDLPGRLPDAQAAGAAIPRV